MPAGRPNKISSPEELYLAIEEYKKYCDKNKEPFTIVGLALHMDIRKETLIEYSKKEGFSNPYKKAMNIAENHLVKYSLTGKYNPTVSIFMLKNNHGYKDKQEIDNTSSDGSMTPKETQIVFTPVGKDD